MAGLLGDIFSTVDTTKRKLTDLLGNPVLSAQQIIGNMNDRARVLNQLTAGAAQERDIYGPKSQQLANMIADAYNPMGMMVYHGSPAKFSRFDPTKIGSGEGAQAYGYGHYVAENPETANQYKEMLKSKAFSKIVQRDRNVYDVIAPDGTIVSQGTVLGKAHKAKDAYDANVGSVYEIDLPDEQIAKMLDWDKPLSEQPEALKALKRLQSEAGDLYPGLSDALQGIELKNTTGQTIYHILQKESGNPLNASSDLKSIGIPGIRYLDQGSRAAPNITNQRLANLYEKHQGNAEAAVDEMMRSVYNTPKKKQEMREAFLKQLETPKTSNFVVFPGNEDLLTILKRNGGLLGLLTP